MSTSGKCPMVKFDHHTREFSNNRSALLKELREHTPLAYTESYGGHWVVTSYALAKQVLDNPEIFSSEKLPDGTRGVTIPSVGPRLLPAEVDPPVHSKLRRLIAPAYTPKSVKALEPVVREITVKLVDDLLRKGDFDIVADVSEVLPPLVGLRHLKFPEEEREAMVAAVKIALSTKVSSDQAAQAFGSACQRMMAFALSRRQSPQEDDLMSVLAQSKDPELSDEELMWLGITLFVGGFKNPGALISNMLLHLGQDIELRQRLIRDRSLIPKAIEEFLRFYTPGVSVARTVTRSTELGGIQLVEGDRVLVPLPGANHDEAMFTNGEVFDIDRETNAKHIAFGGGPHFCVGFRLSYLMFNTLLNEIFDRIPDYVVYADRALRVDDAGIQAGYVTIPASTGMRQAQAA